MTGNRVEIVEVGPRDGLQNERVFIATETKVAFINALADSGLRRIEVTSFVHPKVVPQLADAETVLMGLDRRDGGPRFSALVPNARGLERALRCGVDEVAVFTGSTDGFVQANINMTVEESLACFESVVKAALAAGMAVRGYVSTAFGCPYEGAVASRQGIGVAERLFELGCYEVSIGDTIGVATPGSVASWLDDARQSLPMERLAMHMHDTRGTALCNVMVALDRGVRVFDASCGGLGGCPYAPGASGNLATEDLVFALEGSGCDTGVNLQQLLKASRIIAVEIDHMLPGRYYQAERVHAADPSDASLQPASD